MPLQRGTRRGYKVVDHTADWALWVAGETLAELFANAARALTSLMVADSAQTPAEVSRTIHLQAFDAETLLVDWLSELAFLAEDELLVFGDVDVQEITATELRAVVRGGCVPALQRHIKAVTYHNLHIEQSDDGYSATVVFDV